MLQKLIFIFLGIFVLTSSTAMTIIVTNNSEKNLYFGHLDNDSLSYEYADSVDYQSKSILPTATVEFTDITLHEKEQISYIDDYNIYGHALRLYKTIKTQSHIRIQFIAVDANNKGFHTKIYKIDIPKDKKNRVLFIDYRGLDSNYRPKFTKNFL
ncbi:MAG: hypothetical protein HRT87_00685 [Legionellales bacterium]|nr:hypothetical protein [Legionellales bacterium]